MFVDAVDNVDKVDTVDSQSGFVATALKNVPPLPGSAASASKNFRRNLLMKYRVALSCLAVAVSGCAGLHHDTAGFVRVPRATAEIQVDGKLDEACYRECAPLTAFVVAGEPARIAPEETRAWLFWSEDRLVCAFECGDATPAWAPPNANERDVDGQDRCELFLWAGDAKGPYYCIEAAPGGAVHDYRAHFYRKFDDAWSAERENCRASWTPTGYVVEMAVSKKALDAMGLRLETGARFRAGLFRADYDKYCGEPTWITWIDRPHAPADFHVAESFGTLELAPD